jgi:hypothetical protein
VARAKPGGYIDNAALRRARSASDKTLSDLGLLIAEADRMSPLRRAQLLGRVAQRIAQTSAALAEMEEIRRGGE